MKTAAVAVLALSVGAGGCANGTTESPPLWAREAPAPVAHVHVAARSALLEMGYTVEEDAWLDYVAGRLKGKRSEMTFGHRVVGAILIGTGLIMYTSSNLRLENAYEVRVDVSEIGGSSSRMTVEALLDGSRFDDDSLLEDLWGRINRYLNSLVEDDG
jgi:hypothetical protein